MTDPIYRQTSDAKPRPQLQDEKALVPAATDKLTIWEQLGDLRGDLLAARLVVERHTSDATLIRMAKNEKKMVDLAKDLDQLALIEIFVSEVEKLAPAQFAEDGAARVPDNLTDEKRDGARLDQSSVSREEFEQLQKTIETIETTTKKREIAEKLGNYLGALFFGQPIIGAGLAAIFWGIHSRKGRVKYSIGVHIVNLISLVVLVVGIVRFTYLNCSGGKRKVSQKPQDDLTERLVQSEQRFDGVDLSRLSLPFSQMLIQFLGNGYGLLGFILIKIVSCVCYILIFWKKMNGTVGSFVNDFGEGCLALLLGLGFCMMQLDFIHGNSSDPIRSTIRYNLKFVAMFILVRVYEGTVKETMTFDYFVEKIVSGIIVGLACIGITLSSTVRLPSIIISEIEVFHRKYANLDLVLFLVVLIDLGCCGGAAGLLYSQKFDAFEILLSLWELMWGLLIAWNFYSVRLAFPPKTVALFFPIGVYSAAFWRCDTIYGWIGCFCFGLGITYHCLVVFGKRVTDVLTDRFGENKFVGFIIVVGDIGSVVCIVGIHTLERAFGIVMCEIGLGMIVGFLLVMLFWAYNKPVKTVVAATDENA